MIRLVLVEDSISTSQMLSHILENEGDFDVVGVAANGQEAVSIVKREKPDIVLMDINMPILNGYEASRIIMEEQPVPILLMSATWSLDEVYPVIKSMKLGVLGVVEKPYGPGHMDFEKLVDEICTSLRLMSEVKVVRRKRNETVDEKKDILPFPTKSKRFVLIGSSTGGPPAIHTILRSLPSDYPLPILIVQHMSRTFIETFVSWLDSECEIKVKLAQQNESIEGGCVYVAPDDFHMTLEGNKIKMVSPKEDDKFTPSVSRLFSSVNPSSAPECVAILLSGMGNDGAKEIAELRLKGALTVAQDEASSVVFGMAKEAINRGGIEFVLTPEKIAELLNGLKLKEEGRG